MNRNIFDDLFIFQTEICTSNRSSGCKEIDLVSEELKSIYQSGEVHLVEDVDLTADVVENIVTNISPENINKAPEVRKHYEKLPSERFEQHYVKFVLV